jgi:hypothetical protein
MPEFTVSGKATRLTRETVWWTAVVVATSFGAAEEAARAAVADGDYEEDDVSVEDGDEGTLSDLNVETVQRTGEDPVEEEEDVDGPEDETEYRPAGGAAGYTPAGGATGAEGVSVARVETREGYTPVRVRHVAG